MKQIKCKYAVLFSFLVPLKNAILKPCVFYPYNPHPPVLSGSAWMECYMAHSDIIHQIICL